MLRLLRYRAAEVRVVLERFDNSMCQMTSLVSTVSMTFLQNLIPEVETHRHALKLLLIAGHVDVIITIILVAAPIVYKPLDDAGAEGS